MNLYMVYVYGYVISIWDSKGKAGESLAKHMREGTREAMESGELCIVETIKLNEEIN